VGPSKHEGEDLNYFVTGATGFIGRHLVEELLKRDGTVYALVRDGSKGRLDELGKRLGAGDRLVPVPGDLSKEALGIEGFDQKIDHFFHLAAVYDIESDEDTLRKANVDGTRHTIEFANSIEVGRFHHTSSIAVAGKYKGLFREDMFDEGQKLPHAYHATKFESEKLVRAQVEAPLRIYRPGLVIGNSETGEMEEVVDLLVEALDPERFLGQIARHRHEPVARSEPLAELVEPALGSVAHEGVDGAVALQQLLHEVPADESRGAGHEVVQVLSLMLGRPHCTRTSHGGRMARSARESSAPLGY